MGLALVQGASAKPRKALAPVTDKPRPPRSANLPDEMAERVLDAAARLFSFKGYHATTTRELATLLEIQQASLYHHMASKEDLLYRICRAVMESFLTDKPIALGAAAKPLRFGRLYSKPLERDDRPLRTHHLALIRKV
jgi:AcrR family transcriptional regulator